MKDYELGDEITISEGYTIETTGSVNGSSTLWRSLPMDYHLIGKVVEIIDSFYQNRKNVQELKMERITTSPDGTRLRRNYLLWFDRDSGQLFGGTNIIAF